MISFWSITFVFSSVIMLALLAWRFYLLRGVDKSELVKGITGSDPFFRGFEKKIECFSKYCFNSLGGVCVGKKLNNKFKARFCRLFDYVQGRRTMAKNGCKGYWEKLNSAKKKEK